VSVQLKL